MIRSIRSFVFGAAVLTAAGIAAYVTVRSVSTSAPAQEPSAAAASAAPARQSELAVRLTPDERQALGIELSPAKYRTDRELIRMSATTALDPDALAHVHPRFAGEATRVLARLGQRVEGHQPLLFVWSKDLGEKKSEFIDARSQLKLNREVLDRLKGPYEKGAVPERTYMQAVRDLEASRIAMERAYRTLISWHLTAAEINHIDQEKDTDWPRDTVAAPIAGIVVEKNVVPGELVDPSMNLFVIADLKQIAVWAYASEADALKFHAGDAWQVRVQAVPGTVLHGKISVVGAVVDPTQHTVAIQGTVRNPGQRLRGGMFATASVAVAPAGDQVVVPTSALIDEGERTVVYVRAARDANEFVRREVQVKERLPSKTYLVSGVHPGEQVVSRGALELDQKAQAAE